MPSPSRSLALAGLFAAIASSAAAQSYEFRSPKKGLAVTTAPAPSPSPAPSPAPAPAPTYVAQVSQVALAFEETPVGQSRTAQVLLLNAGTGTLVLQAPQVSGSAFSATTSCAETLAPGASCQAEVTFAPSASGAQTGTLRFASNATAGAIDVPLSGTASLPDGVVTLGGYTWSRPDGVTRSQTAAATYCSQLTLLGGGWRLPSRSEASVVYGTPANRQALVTAGWPNTTWAWMWTSSAYNGSNGWVWRTDSTTAQQGLSNSGIYESFAPPSSGYPVSCVK